MNDTLHSGLPPDRKAELLEKLAAGGSGMALLTRYWIGDRYECECIATGLTISPEHTPGLHRDGEWMTGETFFEPSQVPEPYRDRITMTGVVRIPVRFLLDDVDAVAVGGD